MNTNIRPLIFNTDKPESTIRRWRREMTNQEVARKLFMTIHNNKLTEISVKNSGAQ